MGNVITIDVEFSDALSEHVAELTGDFGPYENVGDYVRELITRDQKLVEHQRFEVLKAELARAFAAPPDSFHPSTPDDVFARNRQ